MISAIVAVDENWGIGYQGDLLASIPDDLKRFKELTTNNVVVMGKNTWESLPKKPLPNRINIVIDYIEKSSCLPNVFFKNLENTKSFINLNSNLNFFIIGGGSIYKQLLSICDQVYVTKIYKAYDNVDTYFSNLDNQNSWIGTPIGEILTYNDVKYQYWMYKKNI